MILRLVTSHGDADAQVKKTNQRIPKAGTTEAADHDSVDVGSSVANFVVGGKQVGKRKGRGGRMYGPGTDTCVTTACMRLFDTLIR